MRLDQLDRVEREIRQLARSVHDVGDWRHAADALLRRVVPYDGACWQTMDPSTLLITGHLTLDLPNRFPLLAANEYLTGDVNKFAELATGAAPVARLSSAFASGLRTVILEQEALTTTEPGPGLILLDPHGEIDALTPAARHWSDLLGSEPLPPAVLSVAATARAVGTARAHARTTHGSWVALHGTQLDAGRTSIIIEPPRPNELVTLLATVYGLTARERELTEHVLLGRSSRQIARALAISPYTVQEHLTNVFEKVGVRSRGELVGQVFFRHCLPDIR